jgi:MOSC domain-containing protein YiiM
MRIVSVNVGGLSELLNRRGQPYLSGIYKSAVTGAVSVTFSGLVGDAQGNLKAHGGPDNAVYAYSADHYAAWRREEERDDLAPGFFGENLTVAALHEQDVRIGDIFRAGSALLEVTQPRLPCETMGIRYGDKHFPDRFLKSRRTGMYLRVLKEGTVQAGDELRRERAGSVTLPEAVEIIEGDGGTLAALRKLAAESALSRRWRAKVDKKLAELAPSVPAAE